MKASRSTIVMTVSRCMAERSLGMTTAITDVAAPVANRRCGELLDGDRAGALAHADEDAAVPDDEHVAALEHRGHVEPVAPDVEVVAPAKSGWWR